MNSQTKICQNCKKDFTIGLGDFSFYEKIKVPPPTFCPECRMIRRLLWRNMRSLYRRSCGLCGKEGLISFYADDGCPVYCIECFNGDKWDQYAHAKDIDWSCDFLSQINELFKIQPRVYQFRIGTVVNSDYGNAIANCKNAYMCFSSIDNEDVFYSENIDRCRNTIDSFSIADLDQCSYNIFSTKNYNSHFLVSSNSCIDSYFLYDCTNCQNCCLSSNLRNQQYVFRNQKLSKEEYEKAVQGLKLDTYSGFEKAKREFNEIYKNAIHKYAYIISSQNVTGDLILNSKNVSNSYDLSNGCENITYCLRLIHAKDLFDVAYVYNGEFCYDCQAVSDGTFNQAFSTYCNGSKNMRYSLFCKNSSDCFGCVGLKNAQYCILNKQYKKEEYFGLIEKLEAHMNAKPYVDSRGLVYKYGEFFPPDFSPFGYNETVTLDWFPTSEEQAIRFGYSWKEKEKKEYPNALRGDALPDSIHHVTDDILNQIISCPSNGNPEYQCTTAFKIVPSELQFYRQKNLPLPRFCPNCRHYERIRTYRNPMRLQKRQCMCTKENHGHEGECENTFETTYAPDRPEKVYCDRCYQAEVY